MEIAEGSSNTFQISTDNMRCVLTKNQNENCYHAHYCNALFEEARTHKRLTWKMLIEIIMYA